MKTTPTAVPLLLARFQEFRPGDIHDVATKAHLSAGFQGCSSNSVTGALWSDDGTALTLSFRGIVTTFMLQGSRLFTICTCSYWKPVSNCPHVVTGWATLKRLVSPETLAHIRFNAQLLSDMRSHLGLEAEERKEPALAEEGKGELKAEVLRVVMGRTAGKTAAQAAAKPAPAPRCRLVIARDIYYGGLCGRIMRGSEVVTSWATSGLPIKLTQFVARNPYPKLTRRYVEEYLKGTDGRYPIVFRNRDGSETQLTYRGDDPCSAGVTLELQGGEVVVSRSLGQGRGIPDGAVAEGDLLISPRTGEIHPVTNPTAWNLYREISARLDATHSVREGARLHDAELYYDDEEFYDVDDEFDDDEEFLSDEELDQEAFSRGVRRLPNGVAVPLTLFNEAGIDLDLGGPGVAESVTFLVNGVPAEPSPPGEPSYLLDLPYGAAGGEVAVKPLGVCDGRIFPCSNSVFWFLNPNTRLRLPAPLRAKKRTRAILETAFRLLDEPRSTRRNAIIRELTSSPDFSKRQVKRDAKELVNYLYDGWDRSAQLLVASSDGWHRVQDDRRSQARLMRLLCDSFGVDAISGDALSPGGLSVPGGLLHNELPRLVTRLEAQGFSLRVGSLPLATARWEFTIDATRSGLDWFELHPEIRCDGELLSRAEVEGLLEGKGVVEINGRLLLLDEAAAGIVAMLGDSLPARKRKGEKVEAVRVPRLQILDWLELRKHGVLVKLAPQDARVLESLLDFAGIPPRPLPDGLDATLRHYQQDAYRWLAFLYEHRFGACLADDMGLGKTLQGITLLAGLMQGEIRSAAPEGTPHLVVAPPSLLFNWEAEIARFFPRAKVLVYGGAGRSSDLFAEHDIVITSYGIVQRDIDLLESLRFDVIVFDETQVVKNLKAATTNAVRRLKGFFNLALTGTPVENHAGEYYAIMDLCLPGLLGKPEEFTRQQAKGAAAPLERLLRRTRPFVLRRTKELIAAELPPKIETDIHLELLPKQKALYQRTVEEVRGQVSDAYASHAPAQARIIALTAILRLRQICLAPLLAAPGGSAASPKLEFLIEQLSELKDEGHSALVFSQFTGYLDLIEEGVRKHGLSCLRLDGSTPVPRRKELVQAFQKASEPVVFLISLKAGGKGLNLTRASYVYHMDPWWNPAVENQASDRAHRIGQTAQVTITRLIMRHTIEEKMMALKQRKLKLYQAILEEGAGSGGAALTREDFEFLLG